MFAPHRMVGEIRLWQGHAPLPAANGILLQNFAEQGALAIERVQADKRRRRLSRWSSRRERVHKLDEIRRKPCYNDIKLTWNHDDPIPINCWRG